MTIAFNCTAHQCMCEELMFESTSEHGGGSPKLPPRLEHVDIPVLPGGCICEWLGSKMGRKQDVALLPPFSARVVNDDHSPAFAVFMPPIDGDSLAL
jgi:hypothetical protein